MTTHNLKTTLPYFALVWSGDKTFEIRFDDRGYQTGDTLVLHEWDRQGTCECTDRTHPVTTCARSTGRTITARVGCVIASTPPRGQQRGFDGRGYVVMSLCDVELVEARMRPGSTIDAFRAMAAAAGALRPLGHAGDQSAEATR